MTSCASYIRVSQDHLTRLQCAGRNLVELVDRLHVEAIADEIVYIDQAWDAIARCLGNGTLDRRGNHDLIHMVLGEDPRDFPRNSQVIAFLSAERVLSLYEQSQQLQKDQLQLRYFSLNQPTNWLLRFWNCTPYEIPLSDEDWHYTWEHFAELREFFRISSSNAQAIVLKITC